MAFMSMLAARGFASPRDFARIICSLSFATLADDSPAIIDGNTRPTKLLNAISTTTHESSVFDPDPIHPNHSIDDHDHDNE